MSERKQTSAWLQLLQAAQLAAALYGVPEDTWKARLDAEAQSYHVQSEQQIVQAAPGDLQTVQDVAQAAIDKLQDEFEQLGDATDLGKEKAEATEPSKAERELTEKQAQEKAELEVQLEVAALQYREAHEDDPVEQQQRDEKKLQAAADQAREAMEARHAEELQRMERETELEHSLEVP